MNSITKMLDLNSLLLSVMLLCGLYFPTSTMGQMSPTLVLINSVIFIIVVVLFAVKYGVYYNTIPFAIMIILLLLIFTIVSPLPNNAYGALLYYLPYSVLICLKLNEVKLNAYLQSLFLLINIVNITIAFGIILGATTITDFLLSNYASFYDELLPLMFAFRKPILTFGTHSVAAFFYYIFFYLNYKYYMVHNKKLYLVLALIYLLLLLFLASTTALVLFIFAAVQTMMNIKSKAKLGSLIFILFIVFLVATNILKNEEVFDSFSNNWELITASDGSGLRARYAKGGQLDATITFLQNHPFRPVGLGFSDDLFYGDSGPIEYLLRGSIFLLFAMYVGFYLFLRNNLTNNRTANFIFVVYIAFEIGFSNLIYLRTICFLPFLIVYLKDLDNCQLPADILVETSA